MTGFSALLTPDTLGDGLRPLLSPDLNVCSIVLPLSGLGLRDVCFIGGANVADDNGVIVLEEDEEVYTGVLEARLPTTARSELFFGIIGGLFGSGGPGRDRSG